MELLTQACWEDVPEIDEASLSAGPWRINQILQIRSNAFALCGGCPSASHKSFDSRACYTQQNASGSGLRPPNLTELMSADRLLMAKIYQFVNKENWNLDDALHESNVRHDMVAVLQPRPRPSGRTTNERRQKTARMDATATSRRIYRKGQQEG